MLSLCVSNRLITQRKGFPLAVAYKPRAESLFISIIGKVLH